MLDVVVSDTKGVKEVDRESVGETRSVKLLREAETDPESSTVVEAVPVSG